MQQDLKCADARHLIHLAVGDDLLDTEERQLADHLPGCDACRTYHSEMVSASHVLEQVRDDVPDSGQQSVWPALSKQLRQRTVAVSQPSEGRRFNVAVATLCACSIALAFVTAIQNLPTAQEPGYVLVPESQLPAMQGMSVQNVSFQPKLTASQVGSAPQLDTARLVPVRQPNGQLILFDPITNQSFVPAGVPIMPAVEGYRF